MVTYDFYKNDYLGSMLSETAFLQVVPRAEDWVTGLENSVQVTPYGPASRSMAVCAVAETMEYFRRNALVAQASVGGVSVRYEQGDKKLQKRLLHNVAPYLTVCRGVGV